jgi:hypothetical protein
MLRSAPFNDPDLPQHEVTVVLALRADSLGQVGAVLDDVLARAHERDDVDVGRVEVAGSPSEEAVSADLPRRAALELVSAEPGAASRRRRGPKRYDAETVAAIIRAALKLKEPLSREAARLRWRDEVPRATTTLIDRVFGLMGGRPLSPAHRERWEREASRMTPDGSVTLDEITQRLR